MNDKEYVEKITNKAIAVVIKEIHKNELKIAEIMETYPEIEYGYKGVMKAEKYREKNQDLQRWVTNVDNAKAVEDRYEHLRSMLYSVINELYRIKDIANLYWDKKEQSHVQHIIDRLENAIHVD